MGKLQAFQADNGIVKYEVGQEYVPMQEMTDTGDRKVFYVDDAPWSGAAGKEATILPDGLATGGVISTAGSNEVFVTSLTLYQGGQLKSITGDDVTVTRDTGYVTHSIVAYDNAGTWGLKSIAGHNSATAYSDTRNSNGGAPYIPVDEIEVGWVRTSGSTAAVIPAADIIQIVGLSVERSDIPSMSIDNAEGTVEFVSALPLAHVGPATKKVYAQVYTPNFADVEVSSDFTPPETTHSQSSTQVYGGAVGSSSSSLNQGSFTAFLKDGITDAIIALKNQKMWFKFFPNRHRSAHLLCQGILGISRSYPAGDNIKAECTITADGPAIEKTE